MGVRGLETFLEKYCGKACYDVSINQLVEQYWETYDTQPVIAVDASSCLRHLYGNLEWLYGGAHKDFGDIVLDFVKTFQSLNVKLIFFFDGPTVERKRNVWVQRRLQHGDEKLKLFDLLKNGQVRSHEDLTREFFQLPSGLRVTFKHIVHHVCGCEVRRTVDECDEEIAAFAKENQCFAILGQDTDFVIFEGPHHYLSVKNLNVRTMHTLKYDRVKLAEALKLTPAELPLLASLIGNDVVRFDQLQDFHSRVCNLSKGRKPPFELLFHKVACFINHMLEKKTMEQALPDIAHTVFKDSSQRALLHASIASYCPRIDVWEPIPGIHWEQLLALARLLHTQCKLGNFVWPVMSGLPFDYSGTNEDYRSRDLPLSGSATLPIRQRAYGILLQEKPGGTRGSPTTVGEWVMAGPGSLDHMKRVPIISPPVPHSGLLLLWDPDNLALTNERWMLFAWGVSSNLNANRLRQLRPHLVVPTMALYYLQNEVGRDMVLPWEMRALVATCVTVHPYVNKHRHLFKLMYNVRCIRLAALFERTVQMVNFLLSVCGNPIKRTECGLFQFFDGRVFPLLYGYAKLGSTDQEMCLGEDELMSEFRLMMSIIYNI